MRMALKTAAFILYFLSVACGSPQKVKKGPPVSLIFPQVDGGEISTLQFRGKYVVLHFFSSWSLGALRDVFELRKIALKYPKQLVVIGVALDYAKFIKIWREETKVEYPIVIGKMRNPAPIRMVRSVPTTVIIGPRGHLLKRIDRSLRSGELTALFQPLLPQ